MQSGHCVRKLPNRFSFFIQKAQILVHNNNWSALSTQPVERKNFKQILLIFNRGLTTQYIDSAGWWRWTSLGEFKNMKNNFFVICVLNRYSNLNSNFAICTKRGKNSAYKSLEIVIKWENAFNSYLLVGTSYKRGIKLCSLIKLSFNFNF